MTAPLSEIFFPSITVCNINQARKSFFDELGIRNNETLIRQIHSEYLGASNKRPKGSLPTELIKQLRQIQELSYLLHLADISNTAKTNFYLILILQFCMKA